MIEINVDGCKGGIGIYGRGRKDDSTPICFNLAIPCQTGKDPTNETEYMAVIYGLILGQLLDTEVIVYTDSKFIVDNLAKKRKIKPLYKKYHETVYNILESARKYGKNLQVKWVSREFNQEADKLSKEARS